MTRERHDLARSVQARLVRHANEIGVDPNVVLTRYGIERFLHRLSISPHSERFVLKGALLMLAWLGERLRPTRDADLLGHGELSDGTLIEIFQDVCDASVKPDAMTFLAASVAVAAIREADAYGGRRVTLNARLGSARIKVQVDIGIGDAITPRARWIDYPSLLDAPRPRLLAYSRETVVAEKVQAMVQLGTRNSRMKDYFDVWALLREGVLEDSVLAEAIAATFTRRRTALPDVEPSGWSDVFATDQLAQSQWRAFLSRSRLAAPPLLDVVQLIRARLVGVLDRARRIRGVIS